MRSSSACCWSRCRISSPPCRRAPSRPSSSPPACRSPTSDRWSGCGGSVRSEFWLALATFLGVAFVGVIEGVFLAVGLSLIEFIQRAWWPHDAVLGRADGVKGYHDLHFYPDARQVPGLLLYRFDAPLFFANAEVFRDRLRERIAEADEPIRWVVIAAEPITDVDTTAAAVLDEIKSELDRRGITLAFAELKDPVKAKLRRYGALTDMPEESMFPTVGTAVSAYLKATGQEWTDWEEGELTRRARTASAMIAGRTACRSPMTAYVARVTIGASRSVLMARIALAERAPTMCWIAPLMPQAMYRSGAIRVPVWPTCWACGRQPAEVTTRDTPDGPAKQRRELVELRETLGAPDAAAATDHDASVGQRDHPLLGGDVRGDPDAEVAIGQVRGERLDRGRRRRPRPRRPARTRAARPSAGGSDRRAEPPRAGSRPSAGG